MFFLPLDGGGVSGSSLSSSARRRWWISLRLRFSEEGGPPVKCLDRVDPCVVDEESLLAGDELRWRLRIDCLSRKLILSFKLGLAVVVVASVSLPSGWSTMVATLGAARYPTILSTLSLPTEERKKTLRGALDYESISQWFKSIYTRRRWKWIRNVFKTKFFRPNQQLFLGINGAFRLGFSFLFFRSRNRKKKRNRICYERKCFVVVF